MNKPKRWNHFSTGIFTQLNEKKEKLEAEGKKLYNLFVGTPDFEPPAHVTRAIVQACADPQNYKYSLRDLPQLLEAVSGYYQERFGVNVPVDCITSVNGTQEGMGHIGLALCDPGDLVLLPDPGYPAFEAGAYIGGTREYFYILKAENNFLPDLSEIPKEIAQEARLMIISYPYNPVCSVAPYSFYEELVAFAKKYNIFIIHDNAYSDILFDGKKGGSFLAVPGAMEVGCEFFSLSKSFNVTGARISFFLGNKEGVDALKLFRSQLDFGMFLPLQYGAIAALTGPRGFVENQCRAYEERRNTLCRGFSAIGWAVPDTQGTMFVWAPIPKGYASSEEFAFALMERAGVMCTPGSAFGKGGEGYVRFALVLPCEELKKVVEAVAQSGVLNP